jgi:hypothetical protein
MHPVAALFLLACLGAIAASWRSRSIAAVSLAWSMVSVWAAANLAWINLAFQWMAWIDLVVAAIGFAIWYEERQQWQRVFAVIFAARVFLHSAYPGAGAVGEAVFFHLYNLTFFAALVAISWRGGISDAVGAIGRYGGIFLLRLRVPALARDTRPADARP